MPDFSVYVTIINNTNEALHKDSTHADWGTWLNVPSEIQPLTTSNKFQIKDSTGPAGTEGTFRFLVGNAQETVTTYLSAYQTCPWGAYNNEFSPGNTNPKAVYTTSFRASVDGGSWTDNRVNTSGHPVTVEFTIDYQKSKRYRFQVVQINARSDHPVRNSRDELIIGDHVLWNRSDPSAWVDGKKGSFQPNVFKYDFVSQVAATSSLTVKIQPLDIELIGAECLIYGMVGNDRVFQSDYFFIKSLNPVDVTTSVINPKTSSKPFVWNADVEWGMELRLSHIGVECVEPKISRLELYWIAQTLHRGFQNRGIPVGFLRNVLKSDQSSTSNVAAFNSTSSEWNQQMTQGVFGSMNKIYDTISGAAAFGVGAWGGIFNQSYYLAPDESGTEGMLYRHVNCMDQCAMLELSCSLQDGVRSTSWLVQQPFGYINDTHLVGVVNQQNQLIPVNNPFFGTDQSRSHVDINDPARTSFGCHVYNGHSRPFVLASDGIYDACGGPHIGNEVAADYLASSIDTQTTLYIHGLQPGTVNNIAVGDGVTGTDGHHWVPPVASEGFTELSRNAVSNILSPLTTETPNSVSHINWAHVPEWINDVLDEDWGVKFGRVSVGDSTTHAFWHLGHDKAEEGSPLRVNVHVESVVNLSGALDTAGSEQAARDRLGTILTSTDRDPEALWVRGTLDEFGQYSLQYASDVAAGRVVVVAGNAIVDISGMSSSAALEDYARKLLGHTVRRDGPPLTMPAIKRGPVRTTGNQESMLLDDNTGRTTVQGVDTRFSLYFELDKGVAAASATPEGTGILFDKYVIEEGLDGAVAVDFMFVAHELGAHTVKVHFTDMETMVSVSKTIEVDVV
ncbi:uncharacterized protein EV420DRAFT_1644911 [Desarmillaria tabescens]|uniref:Uncharacterized protein n=1 Tax=Armillaria tabescens TaxID=1929756 RepID=A0AA39K6N2_ARMTA|nr:uncharacterized protein EV420DRAFT_1644911 [Desarmillaria tabescens]KAK0455273.1 hypothetical protein EV420DRAFT_1644911 [Desarmillaria tabescens]